MVGARPEVLGVDRRPRPGRHRRLAAAAAVLAAAAGVVTAGRSGLDDAPAAGAPRPAPTGTVVALAADEATLVALVDACAGGPETCGLRLVASRDTGRSWQQRTVPVAGLRGADVTRWRMLVHGDVVTVEDGERDVLHHSRDGGRTWVTRPVTAGTPARSVPAGLEDRVVLNRGALTWVDPASGARRTLASRLPVAPRSVRAEGGALWVAGLDRRGRYATASSRDGGVDWATSVLAGARVEPALVLAVVPLPDGDTAWFVSGYPDPDAGMFVFDAWFVGRRGPVQVTPDRSVTLGSGLGLGNGLLLVGPGVPGFTLSPGGTVDSPGEAVLAQVGPTRGLVRGPRGDLVAAADGDRPAVAVSATGDPDDWELRPVAW